MVVWRGFLWFVFLQGVVVQSTTTKSMTAMSRSGLPIYVNDSVIVKLTEEILEETSGRFLHCAVDVITDPSRRLLLHFLSLDISKDNTSPDRLHIYDFPHGDVVKKVTPVMGVFGVYDSYFKDTSPGVWDYQSSRNKFRLDYMGKPNLIYSGFQILITSFADVQSDRCGRLYHRCGRIQICVPLSVMCDTDYNCGEGDDSDENTCHLLVDSDWKGAEATITAVLAGGVAISVFLLVIIAVFCVLKKQNRRSRIRKQSVQMYAKRNAKGEWSVANNIDTLGVTELYAPPTYDDAISKEVMEEPPPSYDIVSTLPMCDQPGTPQSIRSMHRVSTVVCIECPRINNDMRNAEDCPTEGASIDVPENVDSCQEINAEGQSVCSSISETEPLLQPSDDDSKKEDCSKSSSSSREQDSGTFAEESSQGSGSSQLDEDLISVTSDFQMSEDKKYSDTGPKVAGKSAAKVSNGRCRINCDDIEYVDTVGDVNGSSV